MKITKYEHSCFTVEVDGKVLVVDPGNFTTDFQVTDDIVAIVVTHEHGDHFDPTLLAAIYDKNPDSVLISLASVTEKMPDHKSQTVNVGDTITVAPFTLEFFGGTHAQIHPSIPLIDNIGFLINEKLYYPGDSFALPNKPVDVLALPVSAPWLKISETLDFLAAIKPRVAFPTHDAIDSDLGKNLVDRLASGFGKNFDVDYKRLDSMSIDI